MLTHIKHDHLHKNSHNLLGFLDCGIDSVSSSTFLELELEPEGRKYDRNSDRISQPFLNACAHPLIYYSLLITKWRIEETRSSFDGETTTGLENKQLLKGV